MTVAELYAAVLADPPYGDDRLFLGDPKSEGWRYFARLVRRLSPRFVVELGTGAGRTAAQIMSALPFTSRFVTINWPNPPSGDPVGVELEPWNGDVRLTQILGDTRDDRVVKLVGSGIDLLYIDSGTEHVYSLIAEEWRLYSPKLADGAIVICDDLDQNDMMRFWDEMHYDKVLMFGGRMGMFRYVDANKVPIMGAMP